MADGNIEMTFNFGTLEAPPRTGDGSTKKRFRIALLGDFSGRSAKGEVEIGEDLARRRPIKFDIDTVEKVIAGFGTTLVLPIGKKGAGIEVELSNLDALHPDELYENVEMFEGLVALRRRLSSASTSKGTVTELREWGKEFGQPVNPPSRRSGGNAVPADRKLTDFQKLIGGKAKRQAEASPADELISRVVGPYIQKLPGNDVSEMQEAVDEALSGAMRLVLHHPEFQSLESQWRTLDLIARSVETDQTLDIVLYDISAEELAADLAAVEDLTTSGFCELLRESTPDGRGPFSAVCALYTFEETPPHAEILGRIAKVAAHNNVAFFAAISPGFMETPADERHELVAKSWDAMRALPEAAYVGLVTPRFLLRRPYGAKTEPIYEFEFEEFTESEGLSGMLWANPVALVTILLAKSWRKNGASLGLGSIMSLGEIPYIFVNDKYGDQVALPCTERMLTQTKAQAVQTRGFMPVIAVKGRDEVRLGNFNALSGKTILGPWSDVPPPTPKPAATRSAAPSAADEESAGGGDDDLDALLSGLGGDDAPASSGGDDDLDALLAGLGGDDTPTSDGGGDDDLDALLASFGDTSDDDTSSDDEMDPELAALLADL
jgi:predicted component of type VI protein secretion system